MTDPDVRPAPHRRTFARVLCSLVLISLHVLGGYFTLVALMTFSEGPWDTSVTDATRMFATLGLLTEVLAAAVTAALIALVSLRKWWYVIPAVLALTAIARMAFAPEAA